MRVERLDISHTPLAQLPGAKGYDIVMPDGANYHALVSRDEITEGDRRWHISVSGREDVPVWRDLVAIGHRLRPGIVFVVGVPPKSWWMNIHPNVLHLWEMKDAALIEQWRSESRGDTPT